MFWVVGSLSVLCEQQIYKLPIIIRFYEQREERKILRELKVFLDQLERDVLRAQGAEGNLTDKYQVGQKWKWKIPLHHLHCSIYF